jgi:hypothetical protein
VLPAYLHPSIESKTEDWNVKKYRVNWKITGLFDKSEHNAGETVELKPAVAKQYVESGVLSPIGKDEEKDQ